jgi:hypothetical protein
VVFSIVATRRQLFPSEEQALKGLPKFVLRYATMVIEMFALQAVKDLPKIQLVTL